MCYIHLACRAAKPRRVHSCRRKRRSANSVAAPLPRRSVDPASQRRSVAAPNSVEASLPRHSANSVAASIPRRSRVAASTALTASPCSGSAASQRQQRRSVTGPTAASQHHSVAGPWQRRSAAAPPAPGSATAQRRKPTFRPLLPLH